MGAEGSRHRARTPFGARAPDGYRDALEGAVLVARDDRRILRLEGREPARMLSGLATGRTPPEWMPHHEGTLLGGSVPYSTFLTPRGRIVSDLRVGRLAAGGSAPLLIDLPEVALSSVRDHLARYLPPRFAAIAPEAPPQRMLTVIGPEAAGLLARSLIPDIPDGAARMTALAEGEEIVRRAAAAGPGMEPASAPLRIVRNGDVLPPGFDVIGPAEDVEALAALLSNAGCRKGSPELFRVLRVERGRPAFGDELDPETLPPEAGLDDRAIDHRKGCYTGQEVIVRIRDRGKVNRRLRGLLLGAVAPPAPGTPLWVRGRETPVGETRSSVHSPGFGQTIGLGYVRREVEPPDTVRLGTVEGPPVHVRSLEPEGWELVAGDPPGPYVGGLRGRHADPSPPPGTSRNP